MVTELIYPPCEPGHAPEYDWFGRTYRGDYEWVIKHPTKALYFVRWRGVFRKQPVWTDSLRYAARYHPESNFMDMGPGTEAMRQFRKQGCCCCWPAPVLLKVVEIEK